MRSAFLLLYMALTIAAGDRGDLPYLVAALDDPHPELVQDAERQLLLAGPDALPLLRSAAEDELARLAGLRPRIDQLVRELDSDDYATREQAQGELIEVGLEALPTLREAAERGTPEQRARAQEAIEHIEGPPPASGVTAIPVAPAQQCFLANLARAIGAQPDDACVPTLLALAKQPQADVFTPAIDGLDRLGSPAAKEALRSLSSDANVDRRWLARAALMAFGETPARLADFLTEWPSDPVRLRVYCALRLSESPQVVPVAVRAYCKEPPASEPTKRLEIVLSGALDDKALTACAIEALPTAGPKRPFLLMLLREPTPETRESLLCALRGAFVEERRAAVTQAARLFGQQAKEWILPLLEDKSTPVRVAVIAALDAILGPEPAPFEEALRDPAICGLALVPLLTRRSGAASLRDIPDRWGPLTDEEERRLERYASPVMDPSLSEMIEASTGNDDGTIRSALLQLGARMLGPLPPRPLDGFPLVDRLRTIRALSGERRKEALRAALLDEDGSIRRAAVRWCTLLEAEGLEEEVYPYLYEDDPQTTRFARLYLVGRKSEDLLDRVRRRALADAPGASAALWIDWEGRAAAAAVVHRLLESTPPTRELLSALEEAPLRPEDAPALLSLFPTRVDATVLRAWCVAVVRTGSPVGIHTVSQMAAVADGSDACRDALAALAEDPSSGGLVRRILLARGLPVDATMIHHTPIQLNHLANAGDALLLQRALETAPQMLVDSFARTLVRVAPARARELAAAWRASVRIEHRLPALTLQLFLGEEPPAEAFDRTTTSWLIISHGSREILHAATPLLVDPEMESFVWQFLAMRTGHLPERIGNKLVTPIEARDAWERWLAVHGGESQREMIDAALRERGFGEGAEGRIRALTEGPWYLAAAVLRERGSNEIVPKDPAECLDEATRWKASLR